jgi:hypothetical protein
MRTITYSSTTKYVLKYGESIALLTCAEHLIIIWMTEIHVARKKCIISIKTFLKVPSLIHSKLASVWLGLAVGSKKDLGSVVTTRDVERGTVCRTARRPYLSHYIISVTYHIIMFDYIDVNCVRNVLPNYVRFLPKHHSVRHTEHSSFPLERKIDTYIWTEVIFIYCINHREYEPVWKTTRSLFRPWNTNASVLTLQRLRLGWN